MTRSGDERDRRLQKEMRTARSRCGSMTTVDLASGNVAPEHSDPVTCLETAMMALNAGLPPGEGNEDCVYDAMVYLEYVHDMLSPDEAPFRLR